MLAHILELPDLEIARYKVSLQALEYGELPIFLGSTLRGALGYQLKRTVCITEHRDCSKCIVVEKCSYPYIFESAISTSKKKRCQRIPQPFLLTLPPLKPGAKPGTYRNFVLGNKLEFVLTLMGKAITYLPYLIYSIDQMGKIGFGIEQKVRFELLTVDTLGEKFRVYDSLKGQMEEIRDTSILLEEIMCRYNQILYFNNTKQNKVKLDFISPTRIREGSSLQDSFDFNLLITNIVRRLQILLEFYGQDQWEPKTDFAELAKKVKLKSSQLEWWDFRHYSNRQNSHLKLGGVIGKIEFEAENIAQLLPLLAVGELLHVGTATSFGLGKYNIIDI